jgi:uncharacterized membrane protein (DUF2068 family)
VRRERAVAVIIGYKVVKSAVWLGLAATLVVMTQMGLGDRLQGLAEHLQHHPGAWSVELARWVMKASTHRGLWTVALALTGDAALSLVEAWSLWRGHWWGPWVVVVSSGSLLPFEVVSIVRHHHVVRVAVFLVNLAIVVYLARKALREGRERRKGRREASEAERAAGH